jgi:hypothetical protein
MRAVVGLAIIVVAYSGFAKAQTPSTVDMIAGATFVPPPASLPSMPSPEWCKVVDAALANPHADSATRDQYIATGQANHCPHQMFMEPRKAVASPPKKQWHKGGAGAEEFQRTRARCVMNASSAATTTDTRWTLIFASCMRSEGWVLQ